MPFLHSMLHLHRDNPEPMGTWARLEADNTLRKYLDAFDVHWTLLPLEIDVQCRTLLGRGRLPDWVRMPKESESLYTLFETSRPDGLLHSVFMAELAIAWQQQGVIDRHCDLTRWHRRLLPRQEAQRPDECERIRQGMETLGLQLLTGHELAADPDPSPHNPCGRARELAAMIHQAAGPLGVSVILFGSRGRGDHQPESDFDILLKTSLARAEPGLMRKMASVVERTLAEHGQGENTDWAFVDAWNGKRWQDARERTFRGPADGLAFTTDALAQALPIQLQGPARPHGTPFHFLTTGCEVSKFHEPEQKPISFGTYELLDMPRCKKP